jgi:predicted O-linked N-acetylglucosamine transferase (SPINDLY family)
MSEHIAVTAITGAAQVNVDAKLDRARKLQKEGRSAEAEAILGEILHREPRHFEAVHLSGIIAAQSGHMDRAMARFSEAVGIEPGNAVAHNSLGNALVHFGRHAEALASYDRAVALHPGYALAYNNRGIALATLKRYGEAVESYDRALALRPDLLEASYNRGRALSEVGRFDESVQSYDRVLASKPDHVSALVDSGVVLALARRHAAALERFDRALALRPTSIEALANRATALMRLGRPADAVPVLARLLEIAPDLPYVVGDLLYARMLCCDWAGFDELAAAVQRGIKASRPVISPFGYMAIAESESDLRTCAKIYSADHFPPVTINLSGQRRPRARIRIGYSSGEFRAQATSILMAEAWELHDRGRFELIAFDNGRDDGSPLRARITAAFDEMIDITRLSDVDAALLVSRKEIDILVNLNGFFGDARQGMFACRPSPVQVNYLGFPGTLGATYMDYLIADEIVIPPSSRSFYTEKVVTLPGCYQPNDRLRPIADQAPSRADLGLPSEAFVFCCFNKHYKITPRMFEIWTRLLAQIEGSVLWLLQGDQTSAENLRREAGARGIASERLVFATQQPLAAHLARHRAADLFLDTSPCNAHTTASDALWAGLPVLTARGTTFAGRVAASLLTAVGLPEMIAPDLEQYEARALALARNRPALDAVRRKLAANRRAAPLFDTPRFVRHLESAYIRMYERHQAGLPPDHIEVLS